MSSFGTKIETTCPTTTYWDFLGARYLSKFRRLFAKN